MRGRSIVGPFILILLGAAFLFNNVRPDLNLFSFFANYWPFLLIALGALRLLEVLAYAAMSKPLPQQGHGGEILLIILLVIAGTAMFEGRRHFGRFRFAPRALDMFGESFDYPVSQDKAIGAGSRILFDNLRGNIRVSGGDAAEIKISGRKTIRAYNKADADKASEQSPLEVVLQGDRVIVRTNQEKLSDDRKVSTDLEVTVP